MSGDLPSPIRPKVRPGLYGPANLSPERRILIHAEQGFGDALQFVRYVPARCGARRQGRAGGPGTARRSCAHGRRRIASRRRAAIHSRHSTAIVRCSACLGYSRRIWPPSPSAVPYLSAPAEASAGWAERIPATPGPKVGIVWAGTTVGAIDLRLAPTIVGSRRRKLVQSSGRRPVGRHLVSSRSKDRRPLAMAHGFCRNCGRGLSPGSGHQRGHFGCASGGRTRPTDMAPVAVSAGMAMAARARRQPLVSDRAAVPPEEGRGLALCGARGCGRPCANGPSEAILIGTSCKLLRKPKCAVFCWSRYSHLRPAPNLRSAASTAVHSRSRAPASREGRKPRTGAWQSGCVRAVIASWTRRFTKAPPIEPATSLAFSRTGRSDASKHPCVRE